MKILLIADEEDKGLWEYFDPERIRDIDLIISCGDLNYRYLEFLVTMTNVPLLYVRGNHDGAYDNHAPEGCICIDDKVVRCKGLRIMGLGGSMEYIPDQPGTFSEGEMRGRIVKLLPSILKSRGIDILVTHAPARGYGDLEDLPHRGFSCFNDLMARLSPSYMLHGHVHGNYSHDFQRERQHASGARIINAYRSVILEIPEKTEQRKKKHSWRNSHGNADGVQA